MLRECRSTTPHPDKRSAQAQGRPGWLSLLTFLVGVNSVAYLAVWTLLLMNRMGIQSLPLENLRFMSFGLVLVLVAVLWARWEKVPMQRIGMGLRQLPIGITLGVTIMVLAALIEYFYIRVFRLPFDPTIALVAPTRYMSPLRFAVHAFRNWVVVAFSEELVFRGYVQNKLLDLLGGRTGWCRRIGAVGLASFIFGLWHIPNVLATRGPTVEVVAYYVTHAMLFGFVVGLVYDLTGNLWLPVAIHAFSNHPLPYLVGAAPHGVPLLLVPPALTVVCAYRWLVRPCRTPESSS